MGAFIKGHMILTIIAGVGLVVALLAVTLVQTKKVSPVSWGWFGAVNAVQGVAMSGYDPVAYHLSSAAVPGRSDHTHDWKGAIWQFASQENLALFTEDPERYAPQSGGFCSFAVSRGFTAQIDPQAWHIADGKLYVFADQNFRDKWVDEIGDGVVTKTANNWSTRKAPNR